ncbi:hypothetical protein LTR84_008209 [Exophiala bonariae]|uniref:Transcription factor domain-containing protein n=1 Tax=Exophiala bonariae TaxID=1690606 RepID=A0AAV9MXH8_9EURO|nr:hypothetical protein LTR84_008209 [Exophiala bonariae]
MQLKFIIDDREPRTTKDRELRDAEVRAHAARVSHQRKNARCKGPQVVALRGNRAALRDGAEESDDVDGDESLLDENMFLTNNFRRILGGGRVDPFDSSPIQKLPSYVLNILDHAWMDVWSALRPHPRTGVIHPDIYGWRNAGLSCEALFHAYVAGAAGIALASGVGADSKEQIGRTQIYHTVKAINCVSQELSRNDGPPSDALLMAVMTLSGHGEVADEAHGEPYARSPLVQAHRVNVFARLAITPAHSRAIGTLIMKKGGLEGVVLPGFRSLLCLTDVLQGSIASSRPMLPFVGRSESLVSSGVHILDEKARERASVLGTGFWVEGFPAIDEGFQAVLSAACELTTAVDHLQRKENDPPALYDIVEFRTFVQHCLLSLQPRISVPLDTPDYTYEACRLSTLIYSDINIWPLPKSSNIRPRLSQHLKLVLSERAGAEAGAISKDFLLWISMMGAIAARHTEHEQYFLELLARDARTLTWDDFRKTMLEFLWCDFVVAPLARPLWNQACALKAFHRLPIRTVALATAEMTTLSKPKQQESLTTIASRDTQSLSLVDSGVKVLV